MDSEKFAKILHDVLTACSQNGIDVLNNIATHIQALQSATSIYNTEFIEEHKSHSRSGDFQAGSKSPNANPSFRPASELAPTESQITWLKKMNVYRDGLTRDEAKKLLNEAFGKNQK